MDNTDNTGPQDRDRISLEQEHEVRYWTQALGVTADALRQAVQAVGPMADAVRRHLGK